MSNDRGQYIGLWRGSPPAALEQLIKAQQDELRGREESWIDRLSDWWRSFDLGGVLVEYLIFVGTFGSVFMLGIAAGAALYSAVHPACSF